MTYEEYKAAREARIARNIAYMEQGVNFIDIENVYIDEGVIIGAGTTVYPGVILEGKVVIGENVLLGQNTRIKDSTVGDGTDIWSSVIIESQVGKNTHVGPFAYMRPNSKVGDDCKVGDFVEIKNSSFGNGTKASHLTYIGDSDLGDGINLGCGVVFVNYNGTSKFRSVVEDGAFIGCNTNLVSPVHVGKKAYIAAGSTITEDVPDGALSVARERQKNIEGWVEKSGLLNKKK